MQQQQYSPDESNIEKMMDLLHAGGTVAEARGFSEEEIEAIYALSYNLYQQGRHAEAEKIFTFLCFNSHTDARFWVGLAATRQGLKQYQLAIDAYSYAALLKHDNPLVPFQAGLCYMELGLFDAAKKGFTATMHWSKNKPEHEALGLKASAMIDAIKAKKQGVQK